MPRIDWESVFMPSEDSDVLITIAKALFGDSAKTIDWEEVPVAKAVYHLPGKGYAVIRAKLIENGSFVEIKFISE